ncbi:MAG: tRNA (adenosine(37)-N6)-threonylcarbamoyltransferase complex ATPase subunit type 1 TsaE [Syntrophobacteraceae bacterium]|nr:tRNA (adenosine(37)-N6)-threonylcarbamoyltransferase complex ATPase subunit type 1 TsaE [Desulfobacteraceae bacterium]
MNSLTIHSPSEEFSLELGRMIGSILRPGDILALHGELGAGKTLLAQGIARGLGIPADIPITSPTFTFINEYEGRLRLCHLDLYRLGEPDELETLPWREALFGGGVAVIEWPERMGTLLPKERWDVRIEVTGEDSRSISIAALGEKARTRLDALGAELARTSESFPGGR